MHLSLCENLKRRGGANLPPRALKGREHVADPVVLEEFTSKLLESGEGQEGKYLIPAASLMDWMEGDVKEVETVPTTV